MRRLEEVDKQQALVYPEMPFDIGLVKVRVDHEILKTKLILLNDPVYKFKDNKFLKLLIFLLYN